jgi:hypothetical protein
MNARSQNGCGNVLTLPPGEGWGEGALQRSWSHCMISLSRGLSMNRWERWCVSGFAQRGHRRSQRLGSWSQCAFKSRVDGRP